MASTKYDTIIILGTSRVKLLNLRCDKALELLKKNKQAQVIVTGTPSEARVAKLYLSSHGNTQKNVLFETDSNDTIENAFFTKVLLLESNNWRKILIVTSDFHTERAEYVFGKILGDTYEFKVIGAATEMLEDEASHELLKEAEKLRWTKINLQ